MSQPTTFPTYSVSTSGIQPPQSGSNRLTPRLQKSLAALLQSNERLTEVHKRLWGHDAIEIEGDVAGEELDIQSQCVDELVASIESTANRIMDDLNRMAERL